MYKKRLDSDISRSSSVENLTNIQLSFNKKGQVTVFIILGLLLLLTVAIIIALQKEVITFEREEIIPVERGPVESFITSCLKIVTDEALYLMGQQGGFIQLPVSIAADASLHLKTSPFTAVPYWAYGETNAAPTLDDFKRRLDTHIEQNLAVCVLGTQAFQERYNLVARSPVTADTKIVDKKIIFNVNWDIQVKDKQGEIVTELQQFVLESPVRLKAVHDLAVKIINRELRELKLEDLAQDLLALEHPDVPLFGTKFSCQEQRWLINEVKQGIKDLLRVNLLELKVKGTEFVQFPEEFPYYKNHYIWDLEDEAPKPQVSVRFTFQDNYPFTFDVSPRSGQFLRSTQLGSENDLVSVLCLQTWKFIYNLEFPVSIEVTDETTGYTLKLGTTVHLKNNIPDRSITTATKKTTYLDTYSDEEFCKIAAIPMTVKTYELVENQQTGVFSRQPLAGVDVSYVCLKYSCDIGTTQYDYRGLGYAGFITNFPYCSGAVLRGKKESYKENFVKVVSRVNQEVELALTPLKIISLNQIKVVKHTVGSNNLLSPPRKLEDSETALITLKFRQNETSSLAHEVTFVKSPQLDEKITAGEKIVWLAQADFTYDLEINLLEEEKIIGGYKGKWLVPWSSLQDAQEITFHVLSETGLSDTEQLELFLGLERTSALIPPPEIK